MKREKGKGEKGERGEGTEKRIGRIEKKGR